LSYVTLARDHMDELIRTAEGRSSRRDPLISSSWLRCMSNHGLDPTILRPAVIVSDHLLREHQDAMDDLLRRARFGVESLYRQVAGLGYVLLLTDGQGITVDYIGDPNATDDLRSAGLYLGSDWSESSAGTNGVGTCIATHEALVVHKTDHFDASHIPLTCTAAPIFDATGTLAAVLDIAALSSPDDKSSQLLALHVVKNFAHRIETANLIAANRRNWVIRLTATQELADVDTEFVITLDSSGRIIGLNQLARELLKREMGLNGRGNGFLAGSLFSDLFDCEVDRLTQFVNTAGPERNYVRTKNSKRVLFIQVTPPQGVRVLPIVRPVQDTNLPEAMRKVAGEDKSMQASLSKLTRLLNVNMSFLIQGETGTGKEFMAKAIHSASARAHGPFIPVNCAALPESLIESELFGYEAGSFTGAAAKGKKGLIREAHGGTLFLDEIGDMPAASQTRLLRVLAEREVTPIGGARPSSVDIRVIAATHCDLRDLIKRGQFREDLYFRLNGAVVTMPPLRQREDFDWLVQQLLEKRGSGAAWNVSSQALEKLRAYNWPGNIRELVNALDYACALAEGGEITLGDLPEHVVNMTGAECETVTEQMDDEVQSLRNTLKLAQWNVSAAARLIGIDRTTLHRRMRRLGVTLPPRSD
jgi:sigma-54 dependent transcriptional regulator, acetoin dehydrogenase operon transcriptional activator AcoR